MRVKLDENLPESLLASLASLGHDVDNVRMEGLSGRPDPDVAVGASKRALSDHAGHGLLQHEKIRARYAPGVAFGSATSARTNRSGPSSAGCLQIAGCCIMGTM